MDKKTIKAIIDVIKDVSDRPGLYGMQFAGSETGSYLFFTDGYVCVRLDASDFPKQVLDNCWVSGEQLKEIYKGMGARDYATTFKNDEGEVHPNWLKCWDNWADTKTVAAPARIRPETFKKLAPFGDMLMVISENKLGQKLINFSGDKVSAVACPLVER